MKPNQTYVIMQLWNNSLHAAGLKTAVYWKFLFFYNLMHTFSPTSYCMYNIETHQLRLCMWNHTPLETQSCWNCPDSLHRWSSYRSRWWHHSRIVGERPYMDPPAVDLKTPGYHGYQMVQALIEYTFPFQLFQGIFNSTEANIKMCLVIT